MLGRYEPCPERDRIVILRAGVELYDLLLPKGSVTVHCESFVSVADDAIPHSLRRLGAAHWPHAYDSKVVAYVPQEVFDRAPRLYEYLEEETLKLAAE